jgi:hypothetical protein
VSSGPGIHTAGGNPADCCQRITRTMTCAVHIFIVCDISTNQKDNCRLDEVIDPSAGLMVTAHWVAFVTKEVVVLKNDFTLRGFRSNLWPVSQSF